MEAKIGLKIQGSRPTGRVVVADVEESSCLLNRVDPVQLSGTRGHSSGHKRSTKKYCT